MIVKKNITRPESFRYIRAQLEMGKFLSNCILTLAIENGNVFSFVPDGTSEKQLLDFSSGGLYPFEEELGNRKSITPIRNDSKPVVLKEIQSHLYVNTNNCCLFEDLNSSPSDSWVTKSNIEYVHLNGDMFYFFDNLTNNEEKVKKAFTISEAYVLLCVLSSLSPSERIKFTPYQEISLELLELFVKNISAFFVQAYDHEGYLMWTK